MTTLIKNWNSASEYQYTVNLSKAQWAWEFLRRNPKYQQDYQWFISQWLALERDYGIAPDNDYQAWKQDPRSYKIIDLDCEQDGNCAISQDKLLIECWMGYKWGFFQFPVAPEVASSEKTINWRPLTPPENEEIQQQMQELPELLSEQDKSELFMTIALDLTKPLKQQLETVKRHALIAQRRLRKQGRVTAYTIAGKQPLWHRCLQFLDARQQHIDETEIQFYFNLKEPSYDLTVIRNEADYYVNHYLDILTFMEK